MEKSTGGWTYLKAFGLLNKRWWVVSGPAFVSTMLYFGSLWLWPFGPNLLHAKAFEPSVWMIVSGALLSIGVAQYLVWSDERRKDQAAAAEHEKALAAVDRDYKLALDASKAATTKAQEWKDELQRERDKAGNPEVFLQYTHAAQLSSFQLYNRGYADASSVQILSIHLGDEVVHWFPIPQVRARTYEKVDFYIANPKAGTTYVHKNIGLLMGAFATEDEPIVKEPLLITYKGRTGVWETTGEIQYDNRTGLLQIVPGVVRSASPDPPPITQSSLYYT